MIYFCPLNQRCDSVSDDTNQIIHFFLMQPISPFSVILISYEYGISYVYYTISI